MAEPKAEADITYRNLDYSRYYKTEPNNYCFIIHCFGINNNKYPFTPNRFDIALGNYALRAQPTD